MCIPGRYPFSVHLSLKQSICPVLILQNLSAMTYIHNDQSQSYMFHSEALYTFSIFYVPVPM